MRSQPVALIPSGNPADLNVHAGEDILVLGIQGINEHPGDVLSALVQFLLDEALGRPSCWVRREVTLSPTLSRDFVVDAGSRLIYRLASTRDDVVQATTPTVLLLLLLGRRRLGLALSLGLGLRLTLRCR